MRSKAVPGLLLPAVGMVVLQTHPSKVVPGLCLCNRLCYMLEQQCCGTQPDVALGQRFEQLDRQLFHGLCCGLMSTPSTSLNRFRQVC